MIFEFLDKNGISYKRVDHPPVYTCEEAKRFVTDGGGAELKNLFLRDGKGGRYFLAAVAPEKRVDLKALGKAIGVNGLGFASHDRLKKTLNLDPGAVTLLGVLNDVDNLVEVLIDEELWKHGSFQCHPLINTSTLTITREGLEKFFALTAHPPRFLQIPGDVIKIV